MNSLRSSRLTYAIPRVCRKRDISVRTAVQGILRQKPIRIKLFWIWEDIRISMQAVCHDSTYCVFWYWITTWNIWKKNTDTNTNLFINTNSDSQIHAINTSKVVLSQPNDPQYWSIYFSKPSTPSLSVKFFRFVYYFINNNNGVFHSFWRNWDFY